MAGMSLGSGLRVGGNAGVAATWAPQYGTAASYSNGTTASNAAFGSGFTTPTPTAASTMSPKNPHGLAFWIGIASVAGLVMLRRSLPN
jgi:hypothetical protein